jgi:hypothetical protein
MQNSNMQNSNMQNSNMQNSNAHDAHDPQNRHGPRSSAGKMPAKILSKEQMASMQVMTPNMHPSRQRSRTNSGSATPLGKTGIKSSFVSELEGVFPGISEGATTKDMAGGGGSSNVDSTVAGRATITNPGGDDNQQASNQQASNPQASNHQGNEQAEAPRNMSSSDIFGDDFSPLSPQGGPSLNNSMNAGSMNINASGTSPNMMANGNMANTNNNSPYNANTNSPYNAISTVQPRTAAEEIARKSAAQEIAQNMPAAQEVARNMQNSMSQSPANSYEQNSMSPASPYSAITVAGSPQMHAQMPQMPAQMPNTATYDPTQMPSAVTPGTAGSTAAYDPTAAPAPPILTKKNKIRCTLCKRKFETQESLQKHIDFSDLHRENLEKKRQEEAAAAAAGNA